MFRRCFRSVNKLLQKDSPSQPPGNSVRGGQVESMSGVPTPVITMKIQACGLGVVMLRTASAKGGTPSPEGGVPIHRDETSGRLHRPCYQGVDASSFRARLFTTTQRFDKLFSFLVLKMSGLFVLIFLKFIRRVLTLLKSMSEKLAE